MNPDGTTYNKTYRNYPHDPFEEGDDDLLDEIDPWEPDDSPVLPVPRGLDPFNRRLAAMTEESLRLVTDKNRTLQADLVRVKSELESQRRVSDNRFDQIQDLRKQLRKPLTEDEIVQKAADAIRASSDSANEARKWLTAVTNGIVAVIQETQED